MDILRARLALGVTGFHTVVDQVVLKLRSVLDTSKKTSESILIESGNHILSMTMVSGIYVLLVSNI